MQSGSGYSDKPKVDEFWNPKPKDAVLEIKLLSVQDINRFYAMTPSTHSNAYLFPPQDNDNQDLLISFFAVQRHLSAGADWSQDTQTDKLTELKYSYRFICNDSYYGESCSKKCTPRDDRFGHYTCTQNGRLTCLPGWKGKYCEERK